MAITAAELSVIFSSKGAAKVQGEVEDVGNSVQSAGERFGDFYDGIRGGASSAIDSLKGISDALGKVALVGGAAIFGKATKAAWDQVSAVEQATFAMSAYGDSAEDVNAVLQDLTAYAQDASRSGGIFWSEDLFDAAQNLVVMGAELENVSEYVQIMSRAVGLGAAEWDFLATVIGRTGATSRLTAGDFDNLTRMGFQLDQSIRDAAITWEELFAHLERGIPADALLGQADTISGMLLYLQGAFINLGQAFLGVNDDLAFAADGLGSRLVGAIQTAREGLLSLQPAAAAAGQGLAILFDGVSGLISMFQALPSGIQMIVGGALAAVTAFGMLRQAITALRASMNLLGLGAFTRLLSPLGLALTGVALTAGVLWTKWQEGKQATDALAESTRNLKEAQQELLLSGLDEAADRMELFYELMADLDRIATGQWQQRVAMETERGTPMHEILELKDSYIRTTEATKAFTEAQNTLGAALQDVRVDGVALMAEIESLYNRLLSDPEYTLSDFDTDFISLSERVGEFRHEVEETSSAFDGFLSQLNQIGIVDPADAITNSAEAIAFLNDAVAEGVIDMAEFNRLRGDLNRAIADGTITEERAAEILIDYANSAMEAVSAEEQLAEVQERAAASMDLAMEAAAERQEVLEAFIESVLELAGLGDPLGRWNLTEHATAMTRLAQESRDAATALDSILGIYGQIDAMGQRMSAAGGIADALFGEGGDPSDGVGPLRDVFDAGLISVEQFNSAIEDGIAIQERAAESELYLNKIRADQLPVLRETTDAYAALIEEIAGLDPQDQLVALGWLDDGMQAQVQNFTDLVAQMNNFGDAGQDAIQGVIDRIAATDPVLTAMLTDLGLIEQQMDGSYTLSIDAGDAISDMERLTRSIDALTETLGGTPPTYDVDVRTTVNGEAAGPEGIAGLLTNALGNVIGGEAGIDVPVRPSLPDNAADDLRNALSVEPVEVEISPVIKGGASGIGDAVGGALDWIGGGGGTEGTTITIDAVDNATPILANVQAAVAALPDTVDIAISDTGGTHNIAATNLRTLQDLATTLDGTSIDVGVTDTGDTHNVAATNLRTLQDLATTLDSTSIDVGVTDAGGTHNIAATNLRTLIDLSTELDGINPSIEVSVPGAEAAIGTLHAIRNAADAIPRSISVTVTANAIGGFSAGAALGNSVAAGARSALGIRSPSRVFEEIGEWTAAGFERGWENSHHDPSIGFNVDTPNYGAGFGADSGGGRSVTIAPNAVNITVNAETDADAEEIANTVAEKIVPAMESAMTQRRAGFGGVSA